MNHRDLPKVDVPQQAREPYRLSVDQYQRIVQAGVRGKHDRCELIESQLVERTSPHTPPHDGTLAILHEALIRRLPSEWVVRNQKALVLDNSVPEPDIVVVRGDRREFRRRHPAAAEAFLVVEVADSSLRDDRDNARIFARNNIPVYWIVNLIDGVVEVYSQPSGMAYGSRTDFAPGDAVPVILEGQSVGTINVAELFA